MSYDLIQDKNLNVLKYVIDYDKILEKRIFTIESQKKSWHFFLLAILSISSGIPVYYASKYVYDNYYYLNELVISKIMAKFGKYLSIKTK
jgi:hypothetical protein